MKKRDLEKELSHLGWWLYCGAVKTLNLFLGIEKSEKTLLRK